jgi:two-component system, cell cycle response regulator
VGDPGDGADPRASLVSCRARGDPGDTGVLRPGRPRGWPPSSPRSSNPGKMTEPVYRPTRILLVEEEPRDLTALRDTLEAMEDPKYKVEWVEELSRALQRLSLGGVDVVLLDLNLPDSEGLATFERAKAFAPDVPILVLTSMDDQEIAMRTVQAGAQDYLVKGRVDENVLVRSIRYAMERHRLISALRSLSLIDDLTGLYNRRGFMDLGDQHLRLARRTGRTLTLVYVDLDRFKAVNEAHGHHVGDRGLLEVTEILKTTFRGSDILARVGGDEFAVLALEASGEDAETLVRRLRDGVESFNETGGEPFELSISVGVARYEDASRMRLDELLARADAAMHEEKRVKREAMA